MLKRLLLVVPVAIGLAGLVAAKDAPAPATGPSAKGSKPSAPAATGPAALTYEELRAENGRLRARIAELEARVAALSPAPAPAPAARADAPRVPNDDTDPLGIMSDMTGEKFAKRLRGDYPGCTVRQGVTVTKGRLEVRQWRIFASSGGLRASVTATFKDDVLVGSPTVVTAGDADDSPRSSTDATDAVTAGTGGGRSVHV